MMITALRFLYMSQILLEIKFEIYLHQLENLTQI